MQGYKRLVGAVFAFGVKSPQEKAAQYLLLIGFVVEFIVVYDAILGQAQNDFGQAEVPLLLVKFGIPILLFLIFFHQFQIFRNFNLLSNSVDNSGLATIKRFIELLIYIFFGVLTGEAGYMLTVLTFDDQQSILFVLFREIFNSYDLGLILKCLFICFASLICLLVVIWDVLWIAEQNKLEKSKKNDQLFNQFIVLDVLSLLYWIAIMFILIPSLREALGAQYVSSQPFSGSDQPGNVLVAWIAMIALALLYFLVCGKRFLAAAKRLKSADTYEESLKIVV